MYPDKMNFWSIRMRDNVVEIAKSLKGVKWVHQGRTRDGLDCAGLVAFVGHEIGSFNMKDVPSDYPRRPDGTFVSVFSKFLGRKSMKDMQKGDIVIFSQANHPCHCGIVSELRGEKSVIHAHAKRGKVIEESFEQAESVVGRPIFAFGFL